LQLGAYEIAIIGVAGTIAGVLIGAWITYRFALKLSQMAAKREAAIKFRTTFAQERTRLKTYDHMTKPDGGDIIGEAFPKHLIAADEFRDYLAAKDITAFNKAWEEYDAGRKNGEYSHRFKDPKNTNPALPHIVALQCIEKLLEFARPK
jgi:hypothetical protein